MSRSPRRVLPDGWQVARRPDGYWLQRRGEDGGEYVWRDVAGPYRQHGTAIDAYMRRSLRESQRQPA